MIIRLFEKSVEGEALKVELDKRLADQDQKISDLVSKVSQMQVAIALRKKTE